MPRCLRAARCDFRSRRRTMNPPLWLALIPVSLLLSNCGGDSHAETPHHGEGVLATVKSHDAPNRNGDVRIDDAFSNDRLAPVDLKGHQFSIRSREASLDKFPCQRCHKVPLAQMKHDKKDGKA